MGTEQIIFRDTFDGTLDIGWSWLRERPDDWRVQNGGLEICVRPGVKDTVQNALLRPAPDRSEGVHAIEVTITNHTHPTQQYEQAGITWYHDGEPVFKAVKELIDGDLYIIPGKRAMRTQSVRLRLVVTVSTWEAAVSRRRRTHIPNRGPRRTPATGRRSSQHPMLQWPGRRRPLDTLFGLLHQTPVSAETSRSQKKKNSRRGSGLGGCSSIEDVVHGFCRRAITARVPRIHTGRFITSGCSKSKLTSASGVL